MQIQYIADHNGKPSGVFIPIKEWEKLKKYISDDISNQYSEPSKQEILNGIKQSLKEVKLHMQGKIKLQRAKDFLNEL